MGNFMPEPENEMDEQDRDYQVRRIDALEKALVVLREENANLRAQVRDARHKAAQWVAESEQELVTRIERLEERLSFLTYHAV